MRNIPNTKHIIYRKDLDVYEIIKNVNGKNEYFGRYHTLEDAINWRDYFLKHNWNTDLRLIGTVNRNIYFKFGKYRIIKRIKGKDHYFGSFNTIEEAEKRLKEIRLNGWEKTILSNETLQETTTKNIVQLPNGKYHIKKMINGKTFYFGVFTNYDDAVEEVKLLRKCNWDYDALESINDATNGIIFIDTDKMLGTTFEKKHSRPQYMYWAKEVNLI